MKPVIVFDLDDTLYKEADYVDSAFSAIADSLSKYGIDRECAKNAMTEAFSLGNNPIDAVVEKFSPPCSVREMVDTYRIHKPAISLDKRTENVLSTLKSRGFFMALITDGRSISQRNKIEALRLERYFPKNAILISEETGSDKTKPDNFVSVEKTYASSDLFFYVGDNPAKDFVYPNKMGWISVCVKDDGRNIHPQQLDSDGMRCLKYIINDLDELLELVEKFF